MAVYNIEALEIEEPKDSKVSIKELTEADVSFFLRGYSTNSDGKVDLLLTIKGVEVTLRVKDNSYVQLVKSRLDVILAKDADARIGPLVVIRTGKGWRFKNSLIS